MNSGKVGDGNSLLDQRYRAGHEAGFIEGLYFAVEFGLMSYDDIDDILSSMSSQNNM